MILCVYVYMCHCLLLMCFMLYCIIVFVCARDQYMLLILRLQHKLIHVCPQGLVFRVYLYLCIVRYTHHDCLVYVHVYIRYLVRTLGILYGHYVHVHVHVYVRCLICTLGVLYVH